METHDEDNAFAQLVDDCRQSPMSGPDAAIAELDAKHSVREDIEGYAKALLEDVRENGAETDGPRTPPERSRRAQADAVGLGA